jgi:hypothetical protein
MVELELLRHTPAVSRSTPKSPADASLPSSSQAGSFSTPQAPATGAREWPAGSLELAEQLQRSLSIGDRDWHALKGQRPRRAAEQLAGALVQLLAADAPPQPGSSEARQRAIALTSHALAWLQGEIRDPGCPDHGR